MAMKIVSFPIGSMVIFHSYVSHRQRVLFLTGWWFGTFFIFPSIENNHPNWLIFFRGIETTNRLKMVSTNRLKMVSSSPSMASCPQVTLNSCASASEKANLWRNALQLLEQPVDLSLDLLPGCLMNWWRYMKIIQYYVYKYIYIYTYLCVFKDSV